MNAPTTPAAVDAALRWMSTASDVRFAVVVIAVCFLVWLAVKYLSLELFLCFCAACLWATWRACFR